MLRATVVRNEMRSRPKHRLKRGNGNLLTSFFFRCRAVLNWKSFLQVYVSISFFERLFLVVYHQVMWSHAARSEVRAGDTVEFTAPGGKTMMVQIPAGLGPGDKSAEGVRGAAEGYAARD